MMTLLYNGIIVNEGRAYEGYVVIDGELISQVGEGAPSEALKNDCHELVDVSGNYILPGVIDDQVHMRDPGLTHKADLQTESAAAVAGGVTSFMDMPNTNPQTITIEALEAKYQRAAEVSHANYSFYIGATNENLDVVKHVDFKKVCGVKAFLGASTGNMLVDNKNTLERMFSEVDSIIAIHSEDEAIIKANKERLIGQYGENLPVELHPMLRSAEACYECTARAVEMAEKCGTRLHVLHLSTARELPLFEIKPIAEKKITAEVCVHHMWFDDSAYKTLGARIKCNPAVKTIDDRNALRQGLIDGRIDVVATDHAPHLMSEKQGGCLVAASGMPLVQYSLVVMLEMAKNGVFTINQVVDKMCHAPADLYRIDKRGYLRKGYYADIAVVSSDAVGHEVTDADVLSKCAWTPFAGATLHHKVRYTYVNGNLAYANGIVLDSVKGQRLMFNN